MSIVKKVGTTVEINSNGDDLKILNAPDFGNATPRNITIKSGNAAGSSSVDGGSLDIFSGNGDGPGNGGIINILSGNSAGSGGSGGINLSTNGTNFSSGSGTINLNSGLTENSTSGNVNLVTGASSSNSSGGLNLITGSSFTDSGTIFIKTGNISSGDASCGAINLYGGAAPGTGVGGAILIDSGSSVSGSSGAVYIRTSNGYYTGGITLETGQATDIAGSIRLYAGESTSGRNGSIFLRHASSVNGDSAIFISAINSNAKIKTEDVEGFPTKNLEILTGSVIGNADATNSGNLTIKTGTISSGIGSGTGSITIESSANSGGSGSTGSVTLKSGDGNGGSSGSLLIKTGEGQTGTPGTLTISTGSGGSSTAGADLILQTGGFGSGSVGAGNLQITVGGGGSGPGGKYTLTTGHGSSGGNVEITTGQSSSSSGGNFIFTAGHSFLNNGTGGYYNFTAGEGISGSSSSGGYFNFSAGSAVDGTGGHITLDAGDGYAGGAINISSGSGATSASGDVTIFTRESIGSRAGNIFIYSGGSSSPTKTSFVRLLSNSDGSEISMNRKDGVAGSGGVDINPGTGLDARVTLKDNRSFIVRNTSSPSSLNDPLFSIKHNSETIIGNSAEMTLNGDGYVAGSFGVAGGLVLKESVTKPVNGNSVSGVVWLRDDNSLMFTDQNDIDGVIAISGGFSATATTTNATTATLATIAMGTSNTVMSVESTIVTRSSSDGDSAVFKIIGAFENTGGTISQIGTTTVMIQEREDATWQVDYDISGTNVRVRITGEASNTIQWKTFGNVVVHNG